MGYPQGPPQGQGQPPQGQGGYYQQQPQQGYYQQGPPPQSGYAPFQGGQQQFGGGQMSEGGYNWGELYGMADHSIRLLDKGQYDAIVESSSWDRTKDGTKGAWTIVFRTTTGQYPDTKLTMTLAVSKTKRDGAVNDQGMGIMFRHLAAMGIPVPPAQPFWMMGMGEPQVAQAMIGKPVLLSVIQDEYDGITRNKVRDILPPRPGAPTARVQASQQQAPQPFNQPGQVQQQQPQQQWNPQQGYMQQPPPQPGMAPQPYQGQQQGPPPGYQGQPAQGPMSPQQPPGPQGYGQQGPPPGWQPDPSQPPYGQPAAPGQPGYGQFTQQGQAFQPGTNPAQTQQAQQAMQPPFGPNGMPGQQYQQQPPQPPQQGQQEGPPPMPPGMQ